MANSAAGAASDFNSRMIEEFRANEGRIGGAFAGTPMILIHHIGARSGIERVTPLACSHQGEGRFVVVASNGGSPSHPDWYYNLKANPRITVEVGTQTFGVLAEELEGAARAELWPKLVAEFPAVAEHQAKTVRQIPVFMLTRQHWPGPDVRARNTRLYGGPMASVKQFQVAFDCAEPERVGRFWCEVLGYVVTPVPEGFATWADYDRSLPPEQQGSWFACIDPSGVGPRLYFQRVPEGKAVKNRVHLDVRVGTGLVGEERLATLEAECARLVALGAVHVRTLLADDDNESCILMQDIEGNEFDLD